MTRQLLALVAPTVDVGVVRELWRQHGWTVRRGHAPGEPWDLRGARVLLERVVDDRPAAAEVVVEAVRGASVLAIGEDNGVGRALLRDLRRVGEVVQVNPIDSPAAGLDEDQQRLLTAVASGATTAEAAAAAFLSTRTAERRLAAARRALGVRTTAEAATIVAGITFGDVAVIEEYPLLDPSYRAQAPGKEHVDDA